MLHRSKKRGQVRAGYMCTFYEICYWIHKSESGELSADVGWSSEDLVNKCEPLWPPFWTVLIKLTLAFPVSSTLINMYTEITLKIY